MNDSVQSMPAFSETILQEKRATHWFLVFLLCTIQLVWIVEGPVPFTEGGLIDPDSFMRLNRVHHLVNTGEWFSTHYPRSNAPYGEAQHWTRPLDVLLLIGGGIATVFVPFQTGLHYWGVIISPLVQFLALMGILWVARPFFDRDHQLLIGGLFLLQPAVTTYFFAGRPDHHSLLLLGFVLLLGLTMRMIDEPRPVVCAQAGAVAGLAIWISIEAMLAVLVSLSVLALGWMRYGPDWTPRIARMTGWWWVTTTMAMVIEHGIDGFGVPEYDRLSIVHWVVVTAVAGFWQAVRIMDRPTWSTMGQRLGWGVIGLAGIVGVQWSLFPKFFSGPLVDVDPRIMSLVWARVSETQPLVSTEPWQFGRFVFNLGLALPAIPYLIWLVRSEPDRVRHWLWILILLGSLVYFPLAFSELRWVPYAVILMIFPYAQLIGRLLHRLADSLEPVWQQSVKAGVVLVGCTWPLLLGTHLMAAEQSAVGGTTAKDCPLIPLSAYLSEPDGLGREEHTILAFIDFGPELLYRTPHRVVATPYHRNAAGILDAHAIMSSPNADQAYRLVRDRRIDLLLICPSSPTEPVFYGRASESPTLYAQLVRGSSPPWLHELPLPPHLASHFKLFRVAECAR